MLGRAADNVFWMARHVERVESTVRLLRATGLNALLTSSAEGGEGDEAIWSRPLLLTGRMDDFMARYEQISSGRVLAYMLLDRENPASVKSVLACARENARATRHLLTNEIWECLNQTWLAIKDLHFTTVQRTAIDDRLEWLTERCFMFRGALFGSMRRDESLSFANIGMYLERGDHTARLLAGQPERGGAGDDAAAKMREYYEGMALLKALGSYRAYRETFASNLDFGRIAELLILNATVPRSLRGCIDEVVNSLRALNPTADSLKTAHELQYRLQTVQIGLVRRVGLRAFLLDFCQELDEISTQIQRDFMMVQ